MKTNLSPALFVIAASLLTSQTFADDARHTSNANISDWGKPTDPDGDCKFFRAPGELLISVPGSNGPHDLATDVNKTNAPCVLKAVSGDFSIQVKVDGRFAPGTKTSLPGRFAYNGAGLLLMADASNVVCLARGVFQRPGDEPKTYANFEKRVGGELERIGDAADHALPATGPVFLRLARHGQTIFGWVSTDGNKWDALPPKVLPDSWPNKLSVGIVAISTSEQEFNPRFSSFKLAK